MINLAGKPDCDKIIINELTRAGITFKNIPKREGEVGSAIQGEIVTPYGTLTLTRAWSYWVVNGKVPLSVAQKLYAHPEGKSSVRVSGHCMRPAPELPWIEYIDKNNKVLGRLAELEEFSPDSPIRAEILKSEKYRFVEDPAAEGEAFITTYHIDDQAGLLLFAMTLQNEFATTA